MNYVPGTGDKIIIDPDAASETITGIAEEGRTIVITNPNDFPILIHQSDGEVTIIDLRNSASAKDSKV